MAELYAEPGNATLEEAAAGDHRVTLSASTITLVTSSHTTPRA
jgi:hypothetical protein